MEKRHVLSLLGLFVGGMLSLGDGVVVGAPLVLASAYLLAGFDSVSTRDRLTTAVAALDR